MALETGAFMQASSYSAEIVRRAMFALYARTSANNPGIISGGLIGNTDFQISQLGSPNMSVNVSTGEAIVPGNEGGSQGGYYVRGTSTSNLAISTADPTNPRVDTVCLTCGDAQYTLPSGGTSGSLTLQVVTGTPTSGATLSNLSGAAALPGSSLLLGYVLVPAGASSIVTADIKNVATTVGMLASVPYAIVGGGSSTAVPSSTSTAVPVGSIAVGTGVSLTGGAFAIARAGIYQVHATCQFNTATSGYVSVLLAQNGITQPSSRVPPISTDNVIASALGLFKCAAGDGIGVQAYQDSGSTMSGVAVSSAWILYVGALD